MAYKGFTGDVYNVIANSGDKTTVNSIVNSSLINEQSPLANAQRQADLRSQLKQKRPLVIEYPYLYGPSEAVKWKSIELYINPERLSMSNQKIKGKQIARGGIYYHHWGDDHYQLQLTGTTGLSGMQGIEQLEELYHASGTLLKYNKFGPEQVQLKDVREFQIIDYNDPSGTLSDIKRNIGSTKMGILKGKIDERIKKETDVKLPKYGKYTLNVGQVGILKIKKPTQLWFYDPKSKNFSSGVKLTKPGDAWRVYSYVYIRHLGYCYSVGGGWYAKNIKKYIEYHKLPPAQLKALKQYQEKVALAKSRSEIIKKNQEKILNNVVDLYMAGMYNIAMADKIAQAGSELYVWENNYRVQHKSRPSTQQFYQKAMEFFNKYCRELSADLKVTLAYQHTESEYGDDVDDVLGFSAATGSDLNLFDDPYRVNNVSQNSVSNYGDSNNIDHNAKISKGQTGVIKVVKPINIYRGRKGSTQGTYYRQAKVGESLKVFGYRSTNGGQYDLGNNLYMFDKKGYIKYSKVENPKNSSKIPDNDIGVKTSVMAMQRAEAIKTQIAALEEFYKNEASIRSQLQTSALANVGSTITDKWLPRNIIIYFENRAFVGHFDAFSYSRVANTPLINYELRFTVTKQIVGNI